MDQAIKKEYQAPQDGFFTTEMTIRVAVSTQFGAESAKQLVKECLDIPAVVKLEIEDSMQWNPGMYDSQGGIPGGKS